MHQDYILRMIQQLSGFITGLIQLRKGGRSREAIDLIQEAIGRFSGLSATLVHAISEDDLIQLLRARGGVDPDRAWALAELLREEALAYEELGEGNEAVPRFLKSFRLYLEVLDTVDEMPGLLNVDGLEEVVDRISDVELGPATRERMVGYLVSTSRFDRAENIVIWSVESPTASREAVVAAVAFYDSLLTKADAALEAGGLPRDEVETGAKRMLELLAELDRRPIEA